MDRGWCASAIAFRTRDGNSDGVPLGGRTVRCRLSRTHTVRWQRHRAPLHRRVRERRPAARTGGDLQRPEGGPMATVAPLVSKWLPARSAKIDVADNGETITLTVGDAGRLESRRLRDPQGQGFTLRGGGFVSGLGMQEVDLAPSGSRWTDPDLRRFETKSGARGEFSWSA